MYLAYFVGGYGGSHLVPLHGGSSAPDSGRTVRTCISNWVASGAKTHFVQGWPTCSNHEDLIIRTPVGISVASPVFQFSCGGGWRKLCWTVFVPSAVSISLQMSLSHRYTQWNSYQPVIRQVESSGGSILSVFKGFQKGPEHKTPWEK